MVIESLKPSSKIQDLTSAVLPLQLKGGGGKCSWAGRGCSEKKRQIQNQMQRNMIQTLEMAPMAPEGKHSPYVHG